MYSDAKTRGRHIGHGLTGTEIIFPIGLGTAVVGAYELQDGEIDLSEDYVADVNGAIIAHAEKQVYARDEDFAYVVEQNERRQRRRGSTIPRDRYFTRQEKLDDKR